jgi:hypothetical protein
VEYVLDAGTQEYYNGEEKAMAITHIRNLLSGIKVWEGKAWRRINKQERKDIIRALYLLE